MIETFEQGRIGDVLAEVSALRRSSFAQVVHSLGKHETQSPGNHGSRPLPSRGSPPGHGSRGDALTHEHGPGRECEERTALWTSQGAVPRQQPSIILPPNAVGGVPGASGGASNSAQSSAQYQAGDDE